MPPLDSGTIATDLHANSILRNRAGIHISKIPLPTPMSLHTGVHPDDLAFAKLHCMLWKQGLSGHPLDSFCKNIISSPNLRAKYQDNLFAETCFPIHPDWADFFPLSIHSLYIRAEFRKTMFYLKRWLEENKQSPVLSLELDTERRMGEYIGDQEILGVAPPFEDYPEQYFPQGRVNGAFIITGHPGIGKFFHSQ